MPPDAVNSDYSYPWMYARVLGIYHANVIPPGSVSAQRVECFHVCWLQTDFTIASGTSAQRLEHIHFFPNDTGASFGFVHPSHAIRACHLIPAFRHGRTLNYLPSSFARDPKGKWRYYTVNQYAYAFLLAQFLTSNFFQICRLGHVCPIPQLWY